MRHIYPAFLSYTFVTSPTEESFRHFVKYANLKICEICKFNIFEPKANDILKPVMQKGFETIIKFSVLRQGDNVTKCLNKNKIRIQIHNYCRK